MPYWGGSPVEDDWRRLAIPTSSGIAPAASSYSVFPLVEDGGAWRGNMIANTVGFLLSYNFTNTSGNPTAVWTSTYRIGIYTRNVSSLSLLNSASGTWANTAATSNASTRFNGLRLLTIASSQWSSAPYLLDGTEYHVALQFVPGATTTALSIMQALGGVATQTLIGELMSATLTGTALHPYSPFLGLFNATTNAVAGSMAISQITGISSNAQVVPWMRIAQDGVFMA